MGQNKFYVKLTDKHPSYQKGINLPNDKANGMVLRGDRYSLVDEKTVNYLKEEYLEDTYEVTDKDPGNGLQEKNVEVEQKEDEIMDLPGVGAATAEKLAMSGYDSLMSIAIASPGELIQLTGLSEPNARRVIISARDKLDMGFESGEDLLKKRQSVGKITTGSKTFDDILGGGIETGAITEVYGPYASGKTSLAHQLVVNVQLPKEKGGTEGMAVWVDSEGTIRPEYIEKLAKVKGLDPSEVLKNFRGSRSFNSDHQMLLVEKIEELIKEGLPVKLVIVDSLMGHFRSDFHGRGELANRQQKLNTHLHALLKLAHTYDIAVYITNQVMSKPDTFFGDPTEAIGGHVLHHASTYRVYLRKGKKGTRVAKLVDAPAMPDAEAIFQITDEGIKDV